MRRAVLLFALVAACGGGSPSDVDASTDGGGSDSPTNDVVQPAPDGGDAQPPSGTLASKYPGDLGIDQDPAVVWHENFEEGDVAGVTARYDSHADPPGMSLETDVPAKSSGKASMRMTSSDSVNATDLYKELLPGWDEWYVRWYVKYEPGAITWHHVGTWFGGYDPATAWPNPQAGLQPAGDDRFSISIEPVYDVGSGAARFDTYDYWMQMHSWMAQPSGTTAYYGNAVIHQNAFTVDEGSWVCVEVHVKLNTDLASGAGAVLEVWKNDALVQRYDDSGPMGYWIRDKFCPQGADGTECTSYPAPFDTVLDQQERTTSALQLNYFWPQNYITQAGTTAWVEYDDMVVATTRVGCLQ
jgi:hypothetical protein